MIDLLNLKNRDIYIISPHLDDAILSCGGLILHLRKNNRIQIINVFTKASNGPYTLSAKKFLKASNDHSNANELYVQRENEDRKVLTELNVKVLNLGLVDALFRTRKEMNFFTKFVPELIHLYPTYYGHILGKVSKFDDTPKLLREKLGKIVTKDAVILAPFNISDHVDHLIVKETVESLFSRAVYYSEFPYNFRKKDFSKKESYSRSEIAVNHEEKYRLISQYQTQFAGLFNNSSIPRHREIFYQRDTHMLQSRIDTELSNKLFDEWLSLWQSSKYANHINSPYWFKSVLEGYKYKNYLIVSIRIGEKLVGVGYLFSEKIYGINSYTVVPGDFLCGNPFLLNLDKEEQVTKFVSTLEMVDNLVLDNIPEEFVREIKSRTDRVVAFPSSSNYYFDLLKGHDQKAILENRVKLLQRVRKYADKFKIESYTGYNSSAFSKVYSIDSLSRKKTRGYSTFLHKWTKSLFEAFAKNFGKNFCINILFFETKPIAYEIGFIVGEKYFGNQLSFQEEYKKFTPGKVLIVRLIDWLVNAGVRTLDLGSGESEIKRLITSKFRRIYKVFIFRNNFLRNYLKGLYIIRFFTFNLIYKNKFAYKVFKTITSYFGKK